MAAKKQLYFEAAAEDVWLCAEDGTLRFFHHEHPSEPLPQSPRCPEIPAKT